MKSDGVISVKAHSMSLNALKKAIIKRAMSTYFHRFLSKIDSSKSRLNELDMDITYIVYGRLKKPETAVYTTDKDGFTMLYSRFNSCSQFSLYENAMDIIRDWMSEIVEWRIVKVCTFKTFEIVKQGRTG